MRSLRVWLTRYPVPTDQERLWALAQGLHRPESFAAWCGTPRKLIRKAQALVATALAGSSEVRGAARKELLCLYFHPVTGAAKLARPESRG